MCKGIIKDQGKVSTHQDINKSPGFSRREFFKLATLGLTGFFFPNIARPLEVMAKPSTISLINKARFCIYIHLDGGPSHIDTFDLKEGNWTPSNFEPTTFGNIRWPKGLMPTLAEQLSNIAIVRSINAYALVHQLAQVWNQIGRNPTTTLAKVAPNIGSVVALEYDGKDNSNNILPPFIGLHDGIHPAYGQGYFPAQYAPFNLIPNADGIFGTVSLLGEDPFKHRYQVLQSLDSSIRQNSPYGKPIESMSSAYNQAKQIMYNPQIDSIFKLEHQDIEAYGNSSFGNACLVARNIVKNDIGTHFIQINHSNWDHHSNIYAMGNQTGGIYQTAGQFDKGLGKLIADLASTPSKSSTGKTLLDETLIVAMGEFGRTVGNLTAQGGRDHHLQMSALFAGAGIQGNQTIGKTDETGETTIEYGWSRDLIIRPEDIFCTIYSALGIDYTKVLQNDPFKRGFEYVPYAKDGVYAPIDVLWS